MSTTGHADTGPRPERVPTVLDRSATHESLYARAGKRTLDLVVAGVLVVVTAPLWLLASVLVLVSMGRPVFFTQTRVGRSGEPFEIVKFRTMHPDRRQDSDPRFAGRDRRRTHKTARDPRHTGVGRLLRASSLDELPQLLNVVKGDMSLVGPRPELWDVAVAHDLVGHRRHEVRPGITGPRQISPMRSDPIWADTSHDEGYVDDVRLAGDLRILLATVPALVRSTGE